MTPARVTCLRLLTHLRACARCFAADKAGNSMAARIPMIAMTTSNSIRVNPDCEARRLRSLVITKRLHPNQLGSSIRRRSVDGVDGLTLFLDSPRHCHYGTLR